MAVNSQANVFVSDPFNLNVQKFLGITGAYIATLAYPRSGQFSTPNGLAVDGTGSIFVVDQDNDRVQRFNAKNMTFINSWGTTGSLTGQFNTPQGVAVDHNGNVYVTDSGNSRIQEFTQNGTFIKSWSLIGSPNGAASPSGIAVDSSNHVYVTDATNDRVEEFDSSTGLLLRQWGSTGQGVGNFTGPQGIVASPSGSLYVVDSGNNRVEKFTSTGGFLSACFLLSEKRTLYPSGKEARSAAYGRRRHSRSILGLVRAPWTNGESRVSRTINREGSEPRAEHSAPQPDRAEVASP